MKTKIKIPFGHEDETGFHFDDAPEAQFTYADDQRSRDIRQRWFIFTVSAIGFAVGLAYYFLSK